MVEEKSLYKLFILIFALSGFSGLIYESIWAQYLKLFLGHAAYAHTLVLAMFMGGMAIGSWICSRFSSNWKNLLIGYAIIEAIIGVAALLFHNIFDASVQLSYQAVIPNLESPYLAHTFKWTLSAMLILPQSILLGMTFPLMSAGIIRRFPQRPGSSVSFLYFANSIGASIGVLVSGFILIELLGLPGTITFAGIINIGLAYVVWKFAKDDPEYEYAPHFQEPVARTATPANNQWLHLLLAIALLTGAASFIYEIAWIRMLALVLGSSTHAFELMLSAFIFGLAMGGLWIKSRIDKYRDVVYVLAIIQLIMGLFALSTLPLYNLTFDVMQWLFGNIEKTDSGYVLFNISSHAIALAVMLPTTFCAGMTLPLITYTLLKYNHGEKSIGAVYAFNTFGAIIGILAAVHIGMPYLGLKGLLSMGAAIDIAAAISLLFFTQSKYRKTFFAANAIGVGAIILTVFVVELDPYKMSSAVYRHGQLTQAGEVELLYHKDGKTTTVDLQRVDGHVNIRTNGKVDANLNMTDDGKFTLDEPTMILSAIIPLAFNPEAKNAAVIGIGSGLTTHALLASPNLKRVDTIEIESAMAEAAQGFKPRVERTFSDPRSHIHIEDAKTFFSIQNSQYDIIVSEPSNPWVSGIASLFTQEFYATIPNYLTPEGVFAQWVQLYELNIELVASILKALAGAFDDYAIYLASNRDILIIAKKEGKLQSPNNSILEIPSIRGELNRVNINSIADINLRRIGSKSSLNPFFQSYTIASNSDYYPVLDIGAAKARFLNSDAGALSALSYAHLPLATLMDVPDASILTTNITQSRSPVKALFANIGMSVRDYYLDHTVNGIALPIKYRNTVDQVNSIFKNCDSADRSTWINALLNFSSGILPFLTVNELDIIWQDLQSGDCYSKLSAQQQDWISLLHATSQRDGPKIAGLAHWLLKHSIAETDQHFQYLILAAMLGEVLADRPDFAHKIWNAYQHKFGAQDADNIQLRFLLAQFGVTLPDD